MSTLSDNIKTATTAAKEASAIAKRSASAAVDKSKATASRSVESSKALAKKAGDTTSQTLDKNPIVLLAGGLAIGAIAALLIPTTKKEQKAFGKVGKKLNKTAKRAVDAAKSAGKEKVDNLGLNQDSLRDQFRDLVSKASEAVKAAGKAAVDEARKHD
jgi:ElaB/YqjD/DUF883 family membrane-anchored ribosome-binding protein